MKVTVDFNEYHFLNPENNKDNTIYFTIVENMGVEQWLLFAKDAEDAIRVIRENLPVGFELVTFGRVGEVIK